MAIELEGKSYETDEEGYLVNLSDWNDQLANETEHVLGGQQHAPKDERHKFLNLGEDLLFKVQNLRDYLHDQVGPLAGVL